MRKLVLGIAALLIFASCWPFDYFNLPDQLVGEWYVKNQTDERLFISHSKSNGDWLAPGDSLCIYSVSYDESENHAPLFHELLSIDAVSLFDETDKNVRVWLQSKKDQDERSIFDRALWTYYVIHQSSWFTWVFNITDEDIYFVDAEE